MQRTLILSLTTLMGCFALYLVTTPPSAQAEAMQEAGRQGRVAAATTQQNAAELDARIDALMAMSADQRRAELKQLPQEERRSLWMRLKRNQAARNGQQPLTRGTGMTPNRIDFQGQAPSVCLRVAPTQVM